MNYIGVIWTVAPRSVPDQRRVRLSNPSGSGATSSTSASATGAGAGVGEPFAARATAVCEVALEAKRAWEKFPVADFDPGRPDSSAFPQVAA